MARQRRQEQRQAQLAARQKRHEELHRKRLAFARIKHGRLKAMVLALQAPFQKIRRQKLFKAWGVPELPEGLQLSSFQSADDSLCATLRLSDGTEAVGPYRKNFQQAVRELGELRALQQHRGDEALQQEIHRRDVDAMTAFFVQSISWRCSWNPKEWINRWWMMVDYDEVFPRALPDHGTMEKTGSIFVDTTSTTYWNLTMFNRFNAFKHVLSLR